MKNADAEKKKKTGQPEKFFKQAGAIWIRVFGELMPPEKETGEVADPEFWTDGSEKKAMKEILISLRTRAEKKNIEWTEPEMQARLELFLREAHKDDWISKRFQLRIINQAKALIFNNAIKNFSNGSTHRRRAEKAPVIAIKQRGGFGSL